MTRLKRCLPWCARGLLLIVIGFSLTMAWSRSGDGKSAEARGQTEWRVTFEPASDRGLRVNWPGLKKPVPIAQAGRSMASQPGAGKISRIRIVFPPAMTMADADDFVNAIEPALPQVSQWYFEIAEPEKINAIASGVDES